MTIKERTILFKLHEAILKATSGPLTTNTAMLGITQPPPVYQPGTNPLPVLNPAQTQGYNTPIK